MATSDMDLNVHPDSAYSKDAVFWEKYIKGRPKVPASFFDRLFKYHADHGGQFGTIHEPGAGPGLHSPHLAARFDKVIVTDVAESNIEVAKSTLKGAQYEFRVAKLEETIDMPPASVDMVFAAVMFHFTDFKKAFEAVARQLKPGGTFVACLFATPFLDDPKVIDVFRRTMQGGAKQVLGKVPDSYAPNVLANATGYDNVAVPEEYFEPGVVRLKLNEPMGDVPGGSWYAMWMPPEFQEKLRPVNNIGPHDKVVFEDDKDWEISKDLAGLQAISYTYNFDSHTPEMNELWKELGDAMGRREVHGKWVVSSIMATRK